MDYYFIDMLQQYCEERVCYMELNPTFRDVITILKTNSRIKDKEVYCTKCGDSVGAKGDGYDNYTECECEQPLCIDEWQLKKQTRPSVASGAAVNELLENRKIVLQDAFEMVRNGIITENEINDYINLNHGELVE